MPVYFIQSRAIRDDQITLTGDIAHHLRDVLRSRPGEILDLVDENRARYRVRLDQFDKRQIVARILQKEESVQQPAVCVTLAQAVLKGERMDWVIQKATELGVNAILPIITERTIARPQAERESHQRERWQKIAKEAAQQCGRVNVPAIQPVISLDELCKNPPDAAHKLVLWEQERKQSLKSVLAEMKGKGGFETRPYDPAGQHDILILIGPEGGFSPSEIERTQKAGWIPVTMGRRILRAETAAIAVMAVLQYELTDRE